MKVEVPRGKYVLAVSGGVDSMALLNLLSNLAGVELVVTHFDHGIRSDSELDRQLVSAQAAELGFVFEAGRGGLGAAASEETARRARYDFLEKVRRNHKAKAIITAHHQDDLIETALINILRGTNRRGLTAMADNPNIVRPLLSVPKSEILKYAKAKKLEWREDSTNQDTAYLRNHIRQKTLPGLTPDQRRKLVSDIQDLSKVNQDIDEIITTLSHQLRKKDQIDRHLFSLLPNKISRELLAFWLRQDNLGEIDKYEIDRLSLAVKTAKAGTQHEVKGSTQLLIKQQTAQFKITP